MAGPEVGDVAPDFTLPGVTGAERADHHLADLRGSKVVLAFYPGDFTPGCTRQLCSYRDHDDDFSGVDAVVWGISPQDVDSHERFAAKHGFAFPLLADTDKAVGRAYGILGPLGYRRSIFVLDADGVVRYRHVAALIGVTHRKSSELAEVLAGI